MKKKLVCAFLGMAMIMTSLPVYAEQVTDEDVLIAAEDEGTGDLVIIDDSDMEQMDYDVDYTPYDEIVYKYVQAEKEKWDMEKLAEEQMSTVAYYCYKDREDEVMGFLPVDLDHDGTMELLIGAMTGDEYNDKLVLDAYTLKDHKAVKLFESSERNRYYVMCDEYGFGMIANEGSASAAKSAWHYYICNDGKMEIVQAIVYDAETSPDAPWFEAHDDDWDVSNDEPVEEAYAQEIIDTNSEKCTGTGYLYASEGFWVPDREESGYADEFSGYGSFEELIAVLPAGYGYTYRNLKDGEPEYLILTDAVLDQEDGKKASLTAMIYAMTDGGTINVGNCYSYEDDYVLRIKDGVIYCGGNSEMDASVLDAEYGYVMCLYSISEYFDEDGKEYYFGFIRDENSLDAEARTIDGDSDEEFQNAMERYQDAEILEFTVVE